MGEEGGGLLVGGVGRTTRGRWTFFPPIGAAGCYSVAKERRGWLREETNTVERLSTVRRGDYTTKMGQLQPKMRGFSGAAEVLGGPGVAAVQFLGELEDDTGVGGDYESGDDALKRGLGEGGQVGWGIAGRIAPVGRGAESVAGVVVTWLCRIAMMSPVPLCRSRAHGTPLSVHSFRVPSSRIGPTTSLPSRTTT